jgi:hypothetical protein
MVKCRFVGAADFPAIKFPAGVIIGLGGTEAAKFAKPLKRHADFRGVFETTAPFVMHPMRSVVDKNALPFF